MTPSTLYELAGVPETVPAELVRAAALVEGAKPTLEASAALEVLANPGARADYDARSSQGLAFELAIAWGVAAFSASDVGDARAHLERALRIAPDDRALPMLLESLPTGVEPLAPSDAARIEARREVARVRNNSAFPHRLLRYTAAVAGEPGENNGDQEMMTKAARELLQYDIAEAPRSYAMILPVLKEHYHAVYALDTPFFDATAAVLADHAPSAEYERGKQRHRQTGSVAPARTDSPPPLIMPHLKLPPMRLPERRLDLSGIPAPGYSWVGAIVGALLLIEDGPPAMIRGALIGFVLAYTALWLFRRR
jgi:hypothetical protein